jgi:hypothetical protein
MTDSYFHSQEAESFVFLKVPKGLIANKLYRGLSGDGILLYSVMLDRVGLSRQNNWVDAAGRVYIYLTINEIMATLSCSRAKATRTLSHLCDHGLVEKKRQGQGKPNVLYPKKYHA